MILIALGANLPSVYGSPEDTLISAMGALDGVGIKVLRASSIWISAPVPASDQPWYHNAVVAVEAELYIPELLKTLKTIEKNYGRTADIRNAARVLDLDIIAYNDEIFENDTIMVPHPRMHERAFVLMPLQEVSRSFIHPKMGLSVEEMIAQLSPDQQIKRIARDVA